MVENTSIAVIERRCVAAGVSPRALFLSAGVNPSQLYRWRAGKFEPRQSSVRLIEEALESLSNKEAA